MNQRLKHIMNKKNKAEFKVGNPLPKNGSCKHYKNSHRYFRFPCCGKGYPCDECHNDNEREHDMQMAKNMICGFCSAEQKISSECKRCGKQVAKVGTKSRFWEGGKGTRDKKNMSNKDSHKFSGQAKTTSNHKKKNQKQKK